VLIAAAGIGRAPLGGGRIPPPVAQMSTTEWDTVVNTNLTGTFLTNRAVLPAMIACGGGDIVNFSSARAGRHGEPFASAYCASKFAILGLSAALREEAAAYGIRVTSVLPDATRTPMIGTSRSFGPAMSAEQVADLIVRLVRLPRCVQPDPTVIRHFQRE
jgi:NAD(P)-dependent dehydrogenase (short-subunit alcohol dehydrogenase family)